MKFTGREACIVEGLIHKRKEFYRQDSFYKIISFGVIRNDLHLIGDWKAGLIIDEKMAVLPGANTSFQSYRIDPKRFIGSTNPK